MGPSAPQYKWLQSLLSAGNLAGLGLLLLLTTEACSHRSNRLHETQSSPANDGPALVRDLAGRLLDPFQTNDVKAVVFLFIKTDCPISNRYAPEVRRLYERFAAQGVAFWLVHIDPDESIETIRQHRADYRYPERILLDPEHRLVKRAGVQITPEAAVFGPAGRLLYRGRIDDRFVDFGKERPAPTQRDLQAALEAILQGQPVPVATTRAVGCYIPEIK